MRITAVALVLLASGCRVLGVDNANCAHPPCPLPLAMTIAVTNAITGSVVANASMTVSGPIMTSAPCGSTGQCIVFGTAGAYSVTITAPGYEPAQRTVTVPGTNPPCGCPSTTPLQVAIALVPSP